jgi:predicted permease
MNLLLRLALQACPSDFRREYRDSIAQDVRARGLSAAGAAADLLWQGLQMRCENLWRDIVLGARSLAKAPVFTVVVVVTIALAVGINVAAFSILKGVLLDPVPYAHPDRLVFIWATRNGEDNNVDYPDAMDLRRGSKTLSALALETNARGALTGFGKPVELRGWYVSGEYFDALGAHAAIGRLLSTADAGSKNIVIAHELWRGRFNGDASVLGRRVNIDGHLYTIVGVAPPGLLNPGPGFMESSDYWVPIDPRAGGAEERGDHQFWAIGALRPGVTLEQAQADSNRTAMQLAREYPRHDRSRGFHIQPLYNALVSPFRAIIVLLYCAALLVLLIAGANIANLLLVRAAAREHDFAVRTALGATRKRIALQLIAETGIATVAGLAAAIGISALLLHSVDGFFAAAGQAFGMNMLVPGWNRVRLDVPVLFYGAFVTLLFTIVTAALPAYAFRQNRETLNRPRNALRYALAVSETVLAFAVLSIAGLLVHGYAQLERTPAGFYEANTYLVEVDLPASRRYEGNAALERFYGRATEEFRALPGIADAAEALIAGLGSTSSTNYSLQHSVGDRGPNDDVEFNSVTPQFFKTLGIALLAGRTFEKSDTASAQPVAIVSRSFALQHFGNITGALGHFVSVGQSSNGGFPLRRIVGVAADVRHSLSAAPSPEVYAPFSQVTYPGFFVVRTHGGDPSLQTDIDAAIARIDPLLPPPQITSFALLHSLDDLMTRIATVVFLALAAGALILALAGIYGVVAYNVERRTHEFGIRMSLGARASRIALDVVREALVLAAIGVAAGTVLAALAARAMGQLLYQTSPLDAGTYLAAAVLLLAAVSISALVPAMRAMRVQPAAALRYE